ncbi:MAG: MoaD/ThiS family protein [Casimicrobiaceae bacterium]
MPNVPESTLTIVYLARLREVLGRASEAWPLTGPTSAGAIRDALRKRDATWAHELADGRAVRLAVNQAIASPSTLVHPGDELAFLPPVTGG